MPSLQLPIVRRYLWAQGSLLTPPGKGMLLAGRYQVLQYPLLIDTVPEEPPIPMESVPPAASPYLALSPFTVTVPRPFTQVLAPKTQQPLLLLEGVPLESTADSTALPTLLPTLSVSWADATAPQQINWLRQLARLWQPCLENQVAATLLDWQQIRVDAEDIRLLCLETSDRAPSLSELGVQWQTLVPTAARPIQPFLSKLTDRIVGGHGSALGLLRSLTQALADLVAAQPVSIQLATISDRGPMRPRNEDACYPVSGSVQSVNSFPQSLKETPAPFVIVCDGVGGHQGGDIASQTAIREVTRHLQAIAAVPRLTHEAISLALEKAILEANQAIVAQNDAAHSQDRDRMGTTLILALIYGVRLYIAHLGDSRAYRIRRHGCNQITLDDDVAAREMRLGIGLYPDALQAPGSGALVQALGMADARHLRPTVDMHLLTTPSLFALCSDGLSDYGLLDRLWKAELVPVLMGTRALGTASQRLVELANTHNGHDNVTVALVKVEPQAGNTWPMVPADDAELLLAAPATDSPVTQPPPSATAPTLSSRSLMSFLIVGAIVISMGTFAAFAWQRFKVETGGRLTPITAGESLSSEAPPPTSSTPPLAPGGVIPVGDFSVGDYLQIQSSPTVDTPVTLIKTATPPTPPPAVGLPKRILPMGSIVRVVSRQKTPNEELWIQLEVCAVTANSFNPSLTPENSAAVSGQSASEDAVAQPLPLAQSGEQGWFPENVLSIVATPPLNTLPDSPEWCLD